MSVKFGLSVLILFLLAFAGVLELDDVVSALASEIVAGSQFL